MKSDKAVDLLHLNIRDGNLVSRKDISGVEKLLQANREDKRAKYTSNPKILAPRYDLKVLDEQLNKTVTERRLRHEHLQQLKQKGRRRTTKERCLQVCRVLRNNL